MGASQSTSSKLGAVASFTVKVTVFAIWPSIVAIALGATAFVVMHTDLLPAMLDNELTKGQRIVALNYFVGSLVAVGLLYAAYLLRLRHEWPPGFDRARQLHPYLAFVLSGPMVVALTEPRIEIQHQWRTWLYIAIAVLSWWPTFWAWSHRPHSAVPRQRRLSSRQLDILSASVVLALWVGYAYFFSKLSINNHYAFNTRTVDLGIYDNIFFQSSHGRPLDCTFVEGGNHASAHFDPILVLLSPLYRFWPRAEFLLTLQSIWCGAGVVPAYLLGRSQLGSRSWGVVWALVYALHPALHGANLYEFHSLTLLFTPLLLALYFYLSGKLRLYFVSLFFLLLVREDVALLMCFVGLYGVLSEAPEYKRSGWITIFVSLAYFVFVKSTLMASPELFNQGDGAYGFSYYYKEMIPHGAGGIDFLTTALTNPAFIVALATKAEKIQYLLVIFLPLMFLPAWAGRAGIMLLYGIIFTLLASKSAVYSAHFQYSAVLLPVAIALAPVGLRRLQERRAGDPGLTRVIMGCVLVASLLVSWKHGAILENSSFRGGFRTPIRTLSETAKSEYQSFVEFIDEIEPDASLTVTTRLGAHVSNRAEVYRTGQDIDTDYVLLDRRDLKGHAQRSLDRRLKAGKIELVERRRNWTLYRAVSAPTPE